MPEKKQRALPKEHEAEISSANVTAQLDDETENEMEHASEPSPGPEAVDRQNRHRRAVVGGARAVDA